MALRTLNMYVYVCDEQKGNVETCEPVLRVQHHALHKPHKATPQRLTRRLHNWRKFPLKATANSNTPRLSYFSKLTSGQGGPTTIVTDEWWGSY